MMSRDMLLRRKASECLSEHDVIELCRELVRHAVALKLGRPDPHQLGGDNDVQDLDVEDLRINYEGYCAVRDHVNPNWHAIMTASLFLRVSGGGRGVAGVGRGHSVKAARLTCHFGERPYYRTFN